MPVCELNFARSSAIDPPQELTFTGERKGRTDIQKPARIKKIE